MALVMMPTAELHLPHDTIVEKKVVVEDAGFQVVADVNNSDVVEGGEHALLALLESVRNPSKDQVMQAIRSECLTGRSMKDVLRTANAAGWAPLLIASQRGMPAAVKALLACGADVRSREPTSGWTPLMYAVSSGKADIVQDLLAHGACPNEFAKPSDWNALSVAIVSNHQGIMAMLMDAGADGNTIKRRHPHLHETYLAAMTELKAQRDVSQRKPFAKYVKDYDQRC
jgi:ankyrin repeat protein